MNTSKALVPNKWYFFFIKIHTAGCHSYEWELVKGLVASQPTLDRNRIQPESDKGIGTGLVRATQSLQKYIEVHSAAHVYVSAI